MLITVIPLKNYEQAYQQITEIVSQTDGIELRLDYANTIDLLLINRIRQTWNKTLIFTLRSRSQGGQYSQSEFQRRQDLLSLASLAPDYMDIEYEVPSAFLQELNARYPQVQFIRSYHHFTETPEDLSAILDSLQDPACNSYKIATYATKTLDALRMLSFVRDHSRNHSLTGIAMGELGFSTRILSPVMGNAFHYVALDEHHQTASGQVTLKEALETYRLPQLTLHSKVYALLGEPVQLSLGHLLHNQAIEVIKKNAVYLKLRVSPTELPLLLEHCRHLPFEGFSVTMPLKEVIIPLLDEIEPDSQPIHAINSIWVDQGRYSGFNTDGLGAIQTLTSKIHLREKRVVILGAGGAARAIAYAARQQGARVIVLNRTLPKSQKLAKDLGCDFGGLTESHRIKEADVLINTLPIQAYAEAPIQALLSSHNLSHTPLCMEIVYQPIQTPFVQLAQKADCSIVLGYEMYIAQALLQIQRWFHPTELELTSIQHHMQSYF